MYLVQRAPVSRNGGWFREKVHLLVIYSVCKRVYSYFLLLIFFELVYCHSLVALNLMLLLLALKEFCSERIFVIVQSILKRGSEYVVGLNFSKDKFWVIELENLLSLGRREGFVRFFLVCEEELLSFGVMVQSLVLLEG